MNVENGGHLVAIFGGAVSGAEAAHQLSQHGIASVVFDQNTLPYGKIEDGLPKWHVKLRDKEEGKINNKLSHPLVGFVPNAKLGDTVDFEDVARNWGFSAVILATGAWKDRPLPIDGVDNYIGKGFYYQNPYIYWYNHKHEPTYNGPQLSTDDGAIVIGGGLASLDVLKVLMFENVEKALKAAGHDVSMFKLDRSIAKVLGELGLTLEDIGVKGCTLYYRRRPIDMPLSPFPTDTPEQLEKAQKVREKILNNYRDKYLFKVETNCVPVDKIVEGDRITGIVFQRSEVIDGKVKTIPGSEFEVHTPLVISSIGSLPETIPGIPSKGQVYLIDNEELCGIEGYQNVFAVGNAVTGRGNINESLKHGREITQRIIEEKFLDREAVLSEQMKSGSQTVAHQAKGIANIILKNDSLTQEQYAGIMDKVTGLQKNAGYKGDFMEWVNQNLPTRLEDMIDASH